MDGQCQIVIKKWALKHPDGFLLQEILTNDVVLLRTREAARGYIGNHILVDGTRPVKVRVTIEEI
jgi:hypothetical protein